MTSVSIDIVRYRPEFAPDFARLNRAWLQRYFTIEPLDEEMLGDPEGSHSCALWRDSPAGHLKSSRGVSHAPPYAEADVYMEHELEDRAIARHYL